MASKLTRYKKEPEYQRIPTQIARDRSLAIDLLREGYGYDEIVEHINRERRYTYTIANFWQDIDERTIHEIAATFKNGAELVLIEARRLLKCIGYLEDSIEEQQNIGEHRNISAMVKTLLDFNVRLSEIMGLKAYTENRNINAAIDRLTAAGLDVVDSTDRSID